LDEQELRKGLSGTSYLVTAKSRKAKPGEVAITAESLNAISGRPCSAVLVSPYDKKQLTVFSCKAEVEPSHQMAGHLMSRRELAE
jgi:hypothetical protein